MLWDDEQRQIAPALDTSGRDLPTTFGETFSAAWSRNTLFSQDYLGENDRMAALNDYLAKVKTMTGEDVGQQLDYRMPEGAAVSAQDLLRQANAKVNALKGKNPALELEPLSSDELSQNAIAKRRAADADFEETIDRPRGPGATAGRWLGAGAAGVADQINLAALPIAPEAELGIVASAVRWAEIGGAAGLVGTTLAAPYREQVQPGYIQSGAPELEIGEQAAFGALGGAAFPVARAVARPVINQLAGAWGRVRGLPWPTSVKDAGNIVSSEANINQSNIYSGIDGSAAHQQAFAKSTNDILAGRPVDVSQHITPELEARAAVPITPAPAPRPGELPFEPSPTEAQIRWTAWRAGYDMPVEEALRISERLANATPEEAQTIMRDLQMSPRQVADAPARIDPPAKEAPREVTPIEDPHAPEFQAAVRADLDREVAAPPVAGSREEFGQMLARGAPLDELMEHPEVQHALEENKGRAITGTTEDFANPEWRANRVYQFTRPDGSVEEIKGWDAAVNHLADQARGFAGGELRNQRQATILLGKPAAGKSTISEHIARERGAAIVDADEAKKIIPEYENGLGSLAVHDESAELSKEVLKRLVDEGSNIIIPKIGSRVEQIRNYMGMLKYFGYKVDIGVVHIPTELAQRRNLERLFRTGRLVDPEYIRQVGDNPQETAHILRGEANDYASIDTQQNTVEGTGPLADLARARGYNVGGPSEGVERAQAGVAKQGEIAASPIPSAARTGPITAAELDEAGRFPAAVDTAGNVTYQNIDRALSEVDAYKMAADQIAACAGPAPTPQAEAA